MINITFQEGEVLELALTDKDCKDFMQSLDILRSAARELIDIAKGKQFILSDIFIENIENALYKGASWTVRNGR